MATTRLPIDTLQNTFERERHYRPHWPQRWDVASADPLIMATLDILARHVPAYGRRRSDRAQIGLGQAQPPAQAPAPAPGADDQPQLVATVPCACPSQCVAQVSGWPVPKGMHCRMARPAAPRPPVVKRQPGIDFKSRAAGERDDE